MTLLEKKIKGKEIIDYYIGRSDTTDSEFLRIVNEKELNIDECEIISGAWVDSKNHYKGRYNAIIKRR